MFKDYDPDPDLDPHESKSFRRIRIYMKIWTRVAQIRDKNHVNFRYLNISLNKGLKQVLLYRSYQKNSKITIFPCAFTL